MANYYKHLTFVETNGYPFIRTLLSDPYLGQMPRFKPEDTVMALQSTPNSPEEIRLEYGEKDSYGQYQCHAILTRQGIFRERPCRAIYSDGRPTLANGVPFKEARLFFKTFPMPAKPKATITLPVIRVSGVVPSSESVGIIILPRAQIVFGDLPLSQD